MNTQTEAYIYLADQRGCSETPFVRSYHTFNFGPYTAEGREPFGPLLLLNDDSLRAGAGLSMQVEQPTTVLLLPVRGGLEYTIDTTVDYLEPGQLGVLSLPTGTTYGVNNPYEQEYINFLQVWLSNPSVDSLPAGSRLTFDFTKTNTLLPIFEPTGQPNNSQRLIRAFIGRYDGRQDGTYTIGPTAGETGIFVFILQGAFEIANRLLHEKDSLSLRYDQENTLEFEALSNEAILLLIELPL